MVLEDVAGLDGLHQAQVVGVNDGGGQTLHHAHSDQSGVHDGTDVLGALKQPQRQNIRKV